MGPERPGTLNEGWD